MRRLSGLIAVLALTGLAFPLAAADPRIAVTLPAEVKAAFLEEMRTHMESLDDVMAALAKADFKGAAAAARSELGMGGGKGFGRHMPIEFREMGLAMHRSAMEFADRAMAVPMPPSAEDWQQIVGALQEISSQCRACHSAFRIE